MDTSNISGRSFAVCCSSFFIPRWSSNSPQVTLAPADCYAMTEQFPSAEELSFACNVIQRLAKAFFTASGIQPASQGLTHASFPGPSSGHPSVEEFSLALDMILRFIQPYSAASGIQAASQDLLHPSSPGPSFDPPSAEDLTVALDVIRRLVQAHFAASDIQPASQGLLHPSSPSSSSGPSSQNVSISSDVASIVQSDQLIARFVETLRLDDKKTGKM